jgi:hypothetical protein
MHDATQELKTRASILHTRIESGDPAALARLKKLPQFRKAPPEDLRAAKHQDCLNVIAAEWGFPSWPEAKRVLSGEAIAPANFGKLLCPDHFASYLNHWTKDYAQAAALRAERGTYLLAYRTDYLLVERPFRLSVSRAERIEYGVPDCQIIRLPMVQPLRTRLTGRQSKRCPFPMGRS